MNQLLKISEFAHLSGIKRKNLIYYNEIGLLIPERVMDNGYRFYSYRQLETVTVIGALQELGMPLCEIKNYLDARTPETLIELFNIQRKNIEEKILRLKTIKTMIDMRLSITRKALALEGDISKIEVCECKEEMLFASERVACTNMKGLEIAIKEFYDLCGEKQIIYGYPFGAIISRQNLLKNNWKFPSNYFFKIPKMNDEDTSLLKPAGLYLIGVGEANYDGVHNIYGGMFEFIKNRGLEVIGDAYEEYLLDEIAVKNSDKYLMQISIRVKKI